MIKRTVTRGERFWCAARVTPNDERVEVVRIEVVVRSIPARQMTIHGIEVATYGEVWRVDRRDVFNRREDAERWAVMRALGGL
jgi:hypothetical protein